MFPFKEDLSKRQRNFSKGENTCEYIILHHTGTGEGTIKGNIRVLLGETARLVSCHFIVDTNGDAYKLGDPKQILWHAGTSFWNGRKALNKYSVGIEFIGPLKEGFTDAQRKTGFWLIQHLMGVLNIPRENVIRHKDIAPGRKVDINDSFWSNKYKTFEDYRKTLKPRPYN